MILSSADIIKVLGADAIIRQEAKLSVVEGSPGYGAGEYVYIYVDKYPTVSEFEATWKIWVQDSSGMGKYVLDAMTVLLPNFDFNGSHYTTTDFASDKTVIKTEAEKQLEQLAAERQGIKEEFSGLQKGLQARLSTVKDGRDGTDGRDGLDGRDGKDGRDGRDGKDIDATQTELFDLKDVEESLIPLKPGQVLTWDGTKWTNLYVRQTSTFISGGSGSGDGEGVIISDTAPTTREDGSELQEGDQWWDSTTGVMYVWYVDADSSQWVQSSGGDGGGGATTLAGLLDTDTSGAADGEILVYRSATSNWTAEPMPAGGVSSVAGKTGDVVLVKADISDFSEADYATAAQGTLADTAIQPGDNISELTNDAGYITAAEVPDPAQSLDDLTDVTIDPALLEKDFGLVYDGTEWTVASPPVLIDGHNQTGSTLTKGTPVYVAGTHNSGKPLLAAADADGAGTYPAIGLLHEDVANGVDGHVMLSGILANIDTSAYSAGDALYLSTTPGGLTNVRPVAATEKVQKVGVVTRVHATAGSVLIIGAGRTNDINNELVALIGAGNKDAVNLGTFSGDTISDNVSVKVALQEIETAIEAQVGGGTLDGGNFNTGADTADGTAQLDGGLFT